MKSILIHLVIVFLIMSCSQEKEIRNVDIYEIKNIGDLSTTEYTVGKIIKLNDEANEWLKDTLAYIHEGDLLPRRYNSGLEDLDLIVARLEELGIEASHGDYMDVS